MAMEKMWREAFARLERMEAKLDQLLAGQGASPEEAAPWEGYDEATVNDVLARLDSLDEGQRERLLAYERAHRNRSGIVTPLVNWNSRTEP